HEATVEDGEALVAWLDEHVLQQDRQMDRLRVSVIERCRALRIEPPTPDRIERLIRSAVHRHEERFSNAVLARLSADTQAQLNVLVIPGEPSLNRWSESLAGPCSGNCGPIPAAPAWKACAKRLPNPYGLFRLDMNTRLAIEMAENAGQ